MGLQLNWNRRGFFGNGCGCGGLDVRSGQTLGERGKRQRNCSGDGFRPER